MRAFFFFFFLLLSVFALAQESISGTYNYGSIIIHNSQIESFSTGPVSGLSLNYAFPERIGAEWRRFYNDPNFGLNYNFKGYNNPDVVGQSHSVTGFFQLSFLRKRRLVDVGIKGNFGMGFFTEKFDVVKNPDNKAISTSLNFNSGVQFWGKIRLKPMFFEYALGFDHFSNGLVKSPNLGLNSVINIFSVGYEMEEKAQFLKTPVSENLKFIKDEIWVYISGGVKEVEDNPKSYDFLSVSINYSKQISVLNKVGIGFEYLNDGSQTYVGRTKFNYLGESTLDKRYGINVHNEFFAGDFGFLLAYGIYLNDAQNYSSKAYYKVGFKYHFKNVYGIFIIRAVPIFRADVMEFGIGYRFKKYKK